MRQHLLGLVLFLGLAFADNEVRKTPTITLATGDATYYLLQLGVCIFVALVIPFIYYNWFKPESEILPTSAWKEEQEGIIIKFDARYFLHLGWIGPVFGLCSAIVVSILLHYENVTQTHCGDVPNPLPSISAAIGNNIPERWFIRFGILIMAPQRILDCFCQYHYFKKKLPPVKFYHVISVLQLTSNIAENVSLWVVAFISSTEYFPFHEKGFILWTFFQLFKSFAALWLFPKANPHTPAMQQGAFRAMVFSISLNLFAMFCAGIVYYLHSFCYPYMYALYALCEYIIVLSNILFNLSVIYEYPSIRTMRMMLVLTKTPHITVHERAKV